MVMSEGALWTIAELSDRLSAALAEVEYEPPANGQVRAIPDLRTIRYYTSLGLLDRPAAMRGRTALYGGRHLLQLVAVKRLQADGLSLSEVQTQLTGLDDGALAAIARVAEPSPVVSDAAVSAEPSPPRREARFWATRPSPPADDAAFAPAQEGGGPSPDAIARWKMTTRAVLALAPGVSLVIESGDRGAPAAPIIDAALLARAAAPLLKVLGRYGLAGMGEDEEQEEEK